MAETPSTMLPLGTIAPQFELPDVVSGESYTLDSLRAKQGTVIMFICNHCPYVKHIQHRVVEVANAYQDKGFRFVAINSNDAHAYPADSPDRMKIEASLHQYSFPYLYDETQAVAKAYHAACTPDFYLFNNAGACVYRGRFDAATPGNQKPVTGEDLIHAMEALLAGNAISETQLPSLGCNIKWKK